MIPTEIIQSAIRDGISISTEGAEEIELIGEESTIDKWLPVIRENKAMVLKALLHNSSKIAPAPCRGCSRLEILEFQGEDIYGCLYSIPGASFSEGWKRLAVNIRKCVLPRIE